MILDPRLYCSIYALCVAVFFASFAVINNGTGWWERLVGGSFLVAGVTGLINFLDWLWS